MYQEVLYRWLVKSCGCSIICLRHEAASNGIQQFCKAELVNSVCNFPVFLAHKISASNPFAKTAKKQLRLRHGPVASAEYLIFVTKTAKTATATARSTAEQQGEEKEGEEHEIDCGKFFQLHYCSTTVPLLFHYCSTTVPLLAASSSNSSDK